MSNNPNGQALLQNPDSPARSDERPSTHWVFDPVIRLNARVESSRDILQSSSLLVSTLDCIQDGVSILDTALNVKYVNNSMKYWYSVVGDILGLKCYRVYHNQDQPCDNCPILKTIDKRAPHFGIVKYSLPGADKGWQQLFAIPILDRDQQLVGVLEYVRDITYQYQLEQDLNRIMEQYQSLENRSAAITQLLAQRKHEREELEATISENFEKFIKPSLSYLKMKPNAEEVQLLETLIEEIAYPIARQRVSVLDRLTSRELEIASLIRKGKTTSEIATELVVSHKTIDFHRANIRKKLGLQRTDGSLINLASFLNSHV